MNNTSVLNIYGDYRDIDIDYGFTSQDYFVHLLRFSKIADIAKGKNIFDLGCGSYTNLLKAICQMYYGPRFKCYIGTDYNKVKQWRQNYKPIWDKSLILDNHDFTVNEDFDHISTVLHEVFEHEPFIITCFEVLEHMDFNMQNKFLYNLSTLLHDSDLNVEACYFSTPNHNGSPAKNHISELSYKLLEEMFEHYDIKVWYAQGLSANKKYHNPANLVLGPAPVYDKFMPDPLAKMIWGAALPRQFSNNILYTLTSSKDKLEPYTGDDFSSIYKWYDWRQGGKHQADCINLFSKE